jgi:hypothetical protein
MKFFLIALLVFAGCKSNLLQVSVKNQTGEVLNDLTVSFDGATLTFGYLVSGAEKTDNGLRAKIPKSVYVYHKSLGSKKIIPVQNAYPKKSIARLEIVITDKNINAFAK